jgi:hypothetical protein
MKPMQCKSAINAANLVQGMQLQVHSTAAGWLHGCWLAAGFFD